MVEADFFSVLQTATPQSAFHFVHGKTMEPPEILRTTSLTNKRAEVNYVTSAMF